MSVNEIEGWPKEIFTPGDFQPIRKVECAWSDRFNEAAALDGLEYPYAPGCGAFPTEITILPFSGQTNPSGTTATYEKAELTIKYSSKLNTNGVIMEWLSGFEGAEPTAPGQIYFPDVTQRKKHPYVLRSGAIFNHVRRKLGVVPPEIITQVDYVNSAVASSVILGITFAAETLRALMPKISRAWTVSGLTSYYVHQRFAYRSNGGLGWNSAYRADAGAYQYVYDANSNRLYDYPLTSFVLA